MRGRGQRHRVAGGEQPHDHLSGEPGLARAGRPLYRQRPARQPERALAHGVEPRRLEGSAGGLVDVDVAGCAVHERQDAAHDPERAAEARRAAEHHVGDRVEGLLLGLHADRLVRADRDRVARGVTLLERDRGEALAIVELLHGDKPQPNPVKITHRPELDLVVLIVPRVLGEAVRVLADVPQPVDDAAVVDALERGQVAHLGELAPLHAILALVVVEERAHQPRGGVVGEPLAQLLGDQLACLERRVAIDGLLVLLVLLALAHRAGRQVVAQPCIHHARGVAVLRVVRRDLREQGVVVGLQPGLVEDDGVAAAVDIGGPRKPGELLNPLQPVALEPDPQPLPHDLVEVDEHAAGHEPLERLELLDVGLDDAAEHRGLGVRVVVDVQLRMLSTTRADVCDQPVVGRALGCLVVRPILVVVPRTVRIALEPPEQEHQAAVGPPDGVALEVEVDVAGIRRRQQVEPALGLALAMLPHDVVTGERLELQLCLPADLVERVLLDAGDLSNIRQRSQPRQRGHRRRGGSQIDDVVAPDPRHVRGVVLVAPRLLAGHAVRADRAVRVGVGDRRRRRLHEPLEARLLPTRVVDDLAGAHGLAQPRPELDVHALGQRALQLLDRLGVERKLQHVMR